MKHHVFAFAITLSIASTGCKEAGSNLENNHKMEDTLFKTYSTVNRVTANVIDNEEVIIILGDKELYDAPEEKRQQVTEEVAGMVLNIYDADNWLKKGTVIFTSDETNLEVKESLKKEYNMNLEALKAKRGK